jgi:hypothetical protein
MASVDAPIVLCTCPAAPGDRDYFDRRVFAFQGADGLQPITIGPGDVAGDPVSRLLVAFLQFHPTIWSGLDGIPFALQNQTEHLAETGFIIDNQYLGHRFPLHKEALLTLLAASFKREGSFSSE